MHAASAGPPRVLPVTGDGGPKHPSVFSTGRVDILNVDKLLFAQNQVLRDAQARKAAVTAP
jgi:hypothetical protein